MRLARGVWVTVVLGAAGCGASPKWYQTCGYPVCFTGDAGPAPNSGIAACSGAQQAGGACTAVGEQCDPGLGCGVLLACETEDPTKGLGGCPISSRRYKKDITYLGPEDVERLHEALLQLPLASIEDRNGRTRLVPETGATGGATADLYATTSLAVAAVQAQQREIDALRAEIRVLERAAGHQRDPAFGPGAAPPSCESSGEKKLSFLTCSSTANANR